MKTSSCAARSGGKPATCRSFINATGISAAGLAALLGTAVPDWVLAAEPGTPSSLVAPASKLPDHEEFEATLEAPFVSHDARGARTFKLHFDYPGLRGAQAIVWELSLIDDAGHVVRQWVGETALNTEPLTKPVHWDGRLESGSAARPGTYTVTLRASAIDAGRAMRAGPAVGARVSALLGSKAASTEEQSWRIQVGHVPAPDMPAFAGLRQGAASRAVDAMSGAVHGLSVPAPSALPYTVHFANLHSQTNDSDGGGDLSTCEGAPPPQGGAHGPATAFSYAKSAGLDILAATEHNHLFDGSTGTDANGDAASVIRRYHAGRSTAASFNAANPNFLAVYGMEWGVISNGGHLNIFNSDQLFSWEYNASNQLFGDVHTPKSDYAAIYATMRQLGVVGQFNHPASSGQFVIDGTPLAYNADGDQVMVLAEVLNSSAFSHNTTESESSLSNYESAYNKLLERGFHVAPSSNQDNHCANWGRSYTNRTGVLIPDGTALSMSSFLAALRARHVFATMDKTGQIVLTANGHIMGDRFDNSGPLTLSVGYASTAGHTAATVQVFEGVPGRNGSVSTLANSGTVSVTPAPGHHFYYAKVTQEDGKLLWSAPVWVNQGGGGGGGGDTTPPTVTASESGTSGTITLSASASDNIGVTRVDFLVDGSVKRSLSTTPYSLAFDSTTLTNSAHSLVARAYDAAGNVGSSTPFSFSINNVGGSMTETESNGSIASANVVGANSTLTGTMGNSTDKDYFKVTLATNQSLQVNMTGPAGKDYDLYLVDGSGNVLASSESNTSSESFLYKNGAAAKAVYIEVVSYSGSSTTMPYTVRITHP